MRWILVGLLGCATYNINRTARVPHPAVPLRTGEPLAAPIEASFGASSLGGRGTLVNHDAALEVPSQQLRAEFRIRLGQRGELAAIHERAIESSFRPLDRTQAPVEDGNPLGYGVAFRYAVQPPEYPRLSIGLGIEARVWSIPYVQYSTCVLFCRAGAPTMQVTHDSVDVASVAFAVSPAYRIGAWTLFGGLYAARHPTIERKDYTFDLYDADVSSGPYNVLVDAGVELRVSNVSLLALVHQDLTTDPVRYGPSVGLALAAHPD
jgi:hypothetical protein